MKIIALNLPRDLTKFEFFELFKAHGTVESATLVLDKKTGDSKGFGFVEMAKEHEVRAAIAALHSKVIRGSKIRVKIADETKDPAKA